MLTTSRFPGEPVTRQSPTASALNPLERPRTTTPALPMARMWHGGTTTPGFAWQFRPPWTSSNTQQYPGLSWLRQRGLIHV